MGVSLAPHVQMFVGRGVGFRLPEASADRVLLDKARDAMRRLARERAAAGLTVRGTPRKRPDTRWMTPEQRRQRKLALKRRYNQIQREWLMAQGLTARGTPRKRVGYRREWNRRRDGRA